MKNIILSASLILVGAHLAAQETKFSKLNIIPKIGINVAKQEVNILDGESPKAALQAGIAIGIPLGKTNFSLQPEINFVSKGSKVTNSKMREMFILNYVEVPVLANYNFGPLYINAGPTLGILVEQDRKSQQIYGSARSLDLGVLFGAGFSIPTGYGHFIIDGRYNLGLSTVSSLSQVKNKGFALSIGYSIPIY